MGKGHTARVTVGARRVETELRLEAVIAHKVSMTIQFIFFIFV